MPVKTKSLTPTTPKAQLAFLKTEATRLVKAAAKITVTDTLSYEHAGATTKALVELRGKLSDLLSPGIKAAKADYDEKRKALKTVETELLRAEEHLRDGIVDYRNKQEATKAAQVERQLAKGQDVKAAETAAKPFTPEVQGLSFTEHWHAEEDGPEGKKALIKACAEGKVSPDALMINMVWANALARSAKESFSVPGLKAVKETSSSVRA